MPLFDQAFLDELNARSDILDVVSRYVQLKKNGSNYFGLCPFHNEKSPSFSVAPDKQMFYCFGCGAGGGVLSFLMRAEGLSFPDAVRFQAHQLGMPVPETQGDPREAHRRERLFALSTDAARFFHQQLWLPENAGVAQYFMKRGLSRKTMNNFGLGYAPDSFSALLDAMRDKGYTKEEVLEAGLASRSERGRMYDRFRNRVMFPIINVRGQVIAFGGRVMDDSKPKYLNSPETPIFHKSRNLFALNLARKTKNDYFILAEGYMDVIALHQAGFDSAVASLGTSLTEEQVRLISRHTGRIVISYDADGAGQAAAQRAIDLLKKTDLQVKVLRIPGAKDPDEFIKEKGADAYRKLIEQSESDNAYRLETLAAKYDLEEDEERVRFLHDAAAMLAKIDGAVEREVYAGRAAKMARVTLDAMEVEVRRALGIQQKKKKSDERREVRAVVNAAQPRDRTLQYQNIRSAKAEEGIIRLIFADDSLTDEIAARITPQEFTSQVLQKIFAHALTLHRQGHQVTVASFEGYLEENEMQHLTSVLGGDRASTRNWQQALSDYINTIKRCRMKSGAEEPDGEDPLLQMSRIHREKDRSGGNRI